MSAQQPSGAPPQNRGQAGGLAPPQKELMEYSCADCGATNEIKSREPIRCRECGHRIMYKKRTRRMVQFEAR
ncbi:DNA-directed RNA polymerase I [Mycena chlorophos]|uniref:DNA-directed RNA polymerase I n=2 Tax=Mycena chlorophos TaxID=658473 RepID=A0A146IKF0_MYCCL|nr:DNA-directed RNA polymerase I [Mycena chlorophos]GAT60113.1 DNA-directed RNA polymerase I [Mycena chlorophos]